MESGQSQRELSTGRLRRSHGGTSWGAHSAEMTRGPHGGFVHQRKAVLAADMVFFHFLHQQDHCQVEHKSQIFLMPPSCCITSSTTTPSPASGSSDCRLETKPSKPAQPRRSEVTSGEEQFCQLWDMYVGMILVGDVPPSL